MWVSVIWCYQSILKEDYKIAIEKIFLSNLQESQSFILFNFDVNAMLAAEESNIVGNNLLESLGFGR